MCGRPTSNFLVSEPAGCQVNCFAGGETGYFDRVIHMMTSAARQLEGRTLDTGWRVLRMIEPHTTATGGNFSCGYEVENVDDGRRAFLKALDYSWAMQSPDPAHALNIMTSAYIFERDLLKRCRESGLTRIVTAITSGKVVVDGAPMGGLVEYLVFERADGDIRKQMERAADFDLGWRILCLHHIAVGLKQLHAELIAHQDLKPSNVLLFERSSKLADLGRAACKGQAPPHEPFQVAGDPAYAPPELLYGFISPEWNVRRLGCDAYLLGSMIVWFFTGMSATGLLVQYLIPEHRPENWNSTYAEVLPYIREAFSKVLEVFKDSSPAGAGDDLTQMVGELCEPDPALRGHPKNRGKSGVQFSLERYISRLDLLAKRIVYGMYRR